LPSQPSINRGTLILLSPNAKDAAISASNSYFVFQFNPEKLLHTFNQTAQSALATNSTTESQELPSEMFNLTFELDSTDLDLPSQNQTAADLGIHPALAMLENMMQPQTAGKQPIVVFKWGAKRLVAVRLVGMSVEEKAFDATLNPTRATVSLVLKVLDASEVGNSSGAKDVCISHQNVRTTLVDAYKMQTGQAFPTGTVGAAVAASNSATALASSAKTSKTKISA
jgi:hypothetical protein